jgi:hypothetical protein
MSSRSRSTTRYLGRVTRTQLDHAAHTHLTVVPDNDYVPAYVPATALILTAKGATRWTGVVDQQTGRFAYMAPTGGDQWQPTIVGPDGYTGLELADGAA